MTPASCGSCCAVCLVERACFAVCCSCVCLVALALLFAVIVLLRAGAQLKCIGCRVPAPCDVQHRNLAERGLLSFLRLLRAFLLNVTKRNQGRERNGASDRWDSCHATLPPSRSIGCHGTLIRSAAARPHTRGRVPSSSLGRVA